MTKDKKITDGQKLKEAFWEVYKRLGGDDGLLKWAGKNRKRLKLVKKIIEGRKKLGMRKRND